MFKGINTVIFDLDGTIIDSMWVWKQIDIDFLGERGHALPDDLQSSIEGLSFTETAYYFKERFELEDTIEEIKNTWNLMAGESYRCKVALKNNVREFIELLYESGIKLGIATSNSRELVTAIMEKYNLTEYFSEIVTSCDVNKGKPNPDVYLETAKRLEASPKECLVFEDVLHGVMAGKNAGMKVCAIEDDFSIGDKEIIEKTADYYDIDYRESVKAFKIEYK